MGFFSELLGVVAPIAGTLLGGAGGAAVATGIAGLLGGDVPTAVGTGAQLAAARGVDPLLGTNVAQSLAAIGTRATGVACPPTTGGLRKRTIVQTFCPTSGKVFKQEMFAGGVAVRAADAAAAKRFFRQIRKLDAKLPRKISKQSQQKQLTDRLINNALESAGDQNGNGKCP